MNAGLYLARVLGGGAHELSVWCHVKFWFPYVVSGALLIWAVSRELGCNQDLWGRG